jgi:hypothetical protein
MPRPPVKKTRKLAEAQKRGELEAERKFHKKKPLEESFREHVGKILDNIDQPGEIALDAGLAFLGYQVFGNWKGALWGPISLRLARAQNEAAGISGITGLVSLGLAAAIIDVPAFYEAMKNFFVGYPIKMDFQNFIKAPAEQVPEREKWLFERFGHLTTKDYCEWYVEKYPSAQEPIWCIVQRNPKPPEKPPETPKTKLIVNPEWTKWLDEHPGEYVVNNPYPHWIEVPV